MRFVQQDFLLGDEHNPMSLNRYAFVCGNPISFIDPLGMYRGNNNSNDEYKTLGFFTILKSLIALEFFLYSYNRYRLFRLRRTLAIAQAALVPDLILINNLNAQIGMYAFRLEGAGVMLLFWTPVLSLLLNMAKKSWHDLGK
jgi:hypothetical protein